MLIHVWGNVNEIVCFDRVFAWTNGLIFLVYSQILLLQRDFLSNKMNSRNSANDRLRPHIFIYYIYGRFRDFVPTFLSRLTSLSSNLLKNSAVQYYFTAIQLYKNEKIQYNIRVDRSRRKHKSRQNRL